MITNLPNRNKRSIAAFSLVEVVLALSIMAFACVTLIGLLGTGLVTIQKSTATNVQAQIIQAVINNAEVRPYATPYNATLYFDDEGTLQTAAGTSTVYTATITSVAASAGSASTPYALTDASLLQVQVVSASNPNSPNKFSLVWPNTGN